jgi:hypothetical protein
MTTQEVAKRLIDLVAEGKNVQAEEELYADNVISVEQDGRTVTGLEGVKEKTRSALANIEESYGGGVTTAYTGADSFLLEFSMDVKPKGGQRMQMKEWGFYQVKNGKVVYEIFFMQPLQ